MDEERVRNLLSDLLAAMTANSANGHVDVRLNRTQRGFEFMLYMESVELVDITPRTVYDVTRQIETE